MNPKETTNSVLIAEFDYESCIKTNYERRDALREELLRRLNEADALRKENAVIRADNADLLAKQDAFVFVHNNMASDMDALRKENEELRKENFDLYARLNEYSYQFIYGGRSGVETAYVLAAPVLASYRLSHPDGFDAKESEASHE